ncbi:MAG: 4-(cytidine 5'-diphospho)-2-C-methyl-D-erythritol kinase [Verrucomicrobiota bacterium]
MSEAELTLQSPAKINLSLRILKKRSDGFHEIETRMAPVSVFDELSFSRSTALGLQFTCDQEELPLDDSNLVVKAVRLLEKRTRRKFDVAIHLAKHIPHGAGLGGGSGNAAVTLQGLNKLFELKLSDKKLVKFAAEIGSDIPFFIYNSVCDCAGRGESVNPVEGFNRTLPIFLAKPAFNISTPWAYQKWKDSKELPDILYAPQLLTWGSVVNDLERPVFAKHFSLATMKMWLLEQPEVAAALMSGSGSTMIAILREMRLAKQLQKRALTEFGETTWTAICEAG